MTNLSWRDYMRELLKMSDEAVMQALGINKFNRDIAEDWVNGTNYTYQNGGRLLEPSFDLDGEAYIKITPKIKVEFECEKPSSHVNRYTYDHSSLYIYLSGSENGKTCELVLCFKSQEEQEKVFKQLIKAFGG